jgi:hypothetical protein
LAYVNKELQHAKKNNAALTHYINARRKEEDRRKEETHKKAKEGQSSKDVRTWRK